MKRFLRSLALLCALVFVAQPASVRAADFLYDTFTAADTTVLSSHTPETGGTWSRNTGATSSTFAIYNNAVRNNAGGFTNYYNSATPTGSEYDVVTVITVLSDYGAIGAGGRGTPNSYDGYYWVVDHENAPGVIRLYENATQIGSYSTTLAHGDTVTLRITDAAKRVFINGVERITDTTHNSVTGAGVVWILGTYQGTNSTGYAINSIQAGSVTALTIDNPALVSATASSVTLTIGTVSGGTSPYSYQWYRSTTAIFTPGGGNILSGATTATYTDSTVTPGTMYYYKCIVTDSVPNSVTSYQRAARTADVAPFVFGYIGDSLSVREVWNGNVSIADRIERILEDEYKFRSVTQVNQSISGLSTSSWLPGSGNLNTAIAAFTTANVTHVFLRLGINDAQMSVTASAYHDNLEAIAQELYAEGFTVLIAYPTWREPGYHNESNTFDDGAISYVYQYQAQIDTIVAANAGVEAGDTWTIDSTARFAPALLYDRIHFNARGTELAARNDVRALKALLGETLTGSSAQRAYAH